MLSIEILTQFNRWWKTHSVEQELAPDIKRDMFSKIEKYLKLRQIVAVVGLRRTGKTTMMFQVIDNLVKGGVDPKNILYFSFDESVDDIRSLVTLYSEKILKKDIRSEKIYMFLDEIQKLDDWQNKIKIYYDMYPNIKFFVTGSASVNILLDAKETLAGRIFYFELDVLSFEEFLRFKGKDVALLKNDADIWKHEIKIELENYLLRPFPEMIDFDDDVAKVYVKENIVEKAIFRDLRVLFDVKDIELIERLIMIVASDPGLILNLDEISKEVGKSRQTVSNYMRYLKDCFILKDVRNYRGSFKASSRKLKKYYLIHPCIALALADASIGKVAENLVQFASKANLFWREANKEVDFVLQDGSQILPIESKYSSKIRMRDLKGLLRFMDKFGVDTGFVITENCEALEVYKGFNIQFVPLWKYLLGITSQKTI